MKFRDLLEDNFPQSENLVSVEKFFKKPVVQAIFGFNGYSKSRLKKLFTISKLDIKVIEPVQENVYQEGVDYYMDNPPKELPLVILFNNRYFAQNHTRISAQVQKGNKKIDVIIIGWDDNSGSYYKI